MAAPVKIMNFSKIRLLSTIYTRNLHSTRVAWTDQLLEQRAEAVDDDSQERRRAEVEKHRDVCRLPPRVEPFLNSRARRREPEHAQDIEIGNLRREYARLGAASGLDPSIMWPTVEEIKKQEAWEAEWEPTLDEKFRVMKEKRYQDEEYIRKRSEEVATKLKDLPRQIKAFQEKQKKKENLRIEQDLKRQRLLDEAREYFGYQIDARDPKFQEMAARKEEEAKLAAKKEKKAKKLASKMASVT